MLAFNFNLRPYDKALTRTLSAQSIGPWAPPFASRGHYAHHGFPTDNLNRPGAMNDMFPLFFRSGETAVMYTGAHGEAVQVDPMKPMFKAPGSMLLKLIYDEPLSSFTFKFNLRRYSTAAPARRGWT
jgi:hypothetical protein